MACYYPIPAWKVGVNQKGKSELVFKEPKVGSASIFQLKLPCGKCIGCKLERSRQWAMRCVHEASLHDQNSFITLTYDGEHLPKGGSLVKKDFQLFMKRLRKSAVGKRIRFFHCGEYGEENDRPHYHCLLFGMDFHDKVYHKTTDRGDKLYRSATLEKIWQNGGVLVGALTFESAAYVARYTIEKINVSVKSPEKIKRRWEDKYVNKSTGEIKNSEYVTMSRRPGIGRDWYKKYSLDIYPRDYAIMRGMKVRPPKFYDGLLEESCPEQYKRIKSKRRGVGLLMDPLENTDVRLKVKEEVKLAQLRSLSRNLE